MKTYIDVTDISVWDGHHTGTQRVVYQIAKRYYGQPDTEFFIFYEPTNTFHVYNFGEVITRIEAAEQAGDEVSEPPAIPPFRRLVLGVYHKSPASVTKHLTPARRQFMIRALKKAKRSLRPAKASLAAPATPSIQFGKNAIVLIMGKPWDYPTFIDSLRKEKQKQGFKVVQVVYDLIPIISPQLFGRPLVKPYTQHIFETAAISDKLLAISESTKNDMEKFCADMLLPKPAIDVIKLGDDFAKVRPKKPAISGLERGNFILCVGTVEVRKNHQLLYMAYKVAAAEGLKLPKLVIVGGKGWYTNDIQYAFKYDPDIRDLVDIAARPDRELEWLYENCKFTVYPSVYEGWGLPIAESLAHGKLCIASDTSSMPEIAGELIDYFSPYNPQECLARIVEYLDEETLNAKQQEIHKKYQRTSWEETYSQVVRFIKEV